MLLTKGDGPDAQINRQVGTFLSFLVLAQHFTLAWTGKEQESKEFKVRAVHEKEIHAFETIGAIGN